MLRNLLGKNTMIQRVDLPEFGCVRNFSEGDLLHRKSAPFAGTAEF